MASGVRCSASVGRPVLVRFGTRTYSPLINESLLAEYYFHLLSREPAALMALSSSPRGSCGPHQVACTRQAGEKAALARWLRFRHAKSDEKLRAKGQLLAWAFGRDSDPDRDPLRGHLIY